VLEHEIRKSFIYLSPEFPNCRDQGPQTSSWLPQLVPTPRTQTKEPRISRRAPQARIKPHLRTTARASPKLSRKEKEVNR